MFAYFLNLGPWEMGLILVLAVILFGKRLPEVGRSVGKSIVEFKKGMRGVEDEINRASHASDTNNSRTNRADDTRDEPTAPKFEPPPVEAMKEAATD